MHMYNSCQNKVLACFSMKTNKEWHVSRNHGQRLQPTPFTEKESQINLKQMKLLPSLIMRKNYKLQHSKILFFNLLC